MKEWLITNGIGGFASSTDKGGMNTRRYHGLLIAPLTPPRQRTLILSKVDESIEINNKKYDLFTNECNGEISTGYKYQVDFKKELLPVYTFKVDGVIIQKTICMVYGKNAVVVQYKIANKKAQTKINLTPIMNFRDFHSEYHDEKFKYSQKAYVNRSSIDFTDKGKVNIFVSDSKYEKYSSNIFYNMYYRTEKDRGFDCTENHLIPGTFAVEIKPNEDKVITFVCAVDGRNGFSINDIKNVDSEQIIKDEEERIKNEISESGLLKSNSTLDLNNDNEISTEDNEIYKDLVNKFIIASDNFIVYRRFRKLHTTFAGYPWFMDWGRDSFISFEGLLLIPKRYEIAKQVLLTFAYKVKDGLIPNGFNEYDGSPMYNSVDASLLFIDCVGKYLKYTGDYNFVKTRLYKIMKSIIDNYIDGINIDDNNIYLDTKDYLLVSGTDNTQNTWMDAKVNGKAITPRNGKAVEINAMWYNALRVMRDINSHWKKTLSNMEYSYIAKKCKASFEKTFYNENKKCLYDVILVDKDDFGTNNIGVDDKIRPNQLFAISMQYPVIDCDSEIAKEIFVTVTKKLYNKYGLRTLTADEEGYVEKYEGNPVQRDSSYHQGPTWPWLLGPYYDSMKNLIKFESNEEEKNGLEKILMKFRINVSITFLNELVNGNTIGSICEIYDSDETGKGKGAFAQAWSVSEVFRIIFGV